MIKIEKRSAERLAYTLRAKVLDSSTNRVLSDEARIQNINRDGLSLSTENRLAPQAAYRFKISLNYLDAIHLKGRIVHTQKDHYFQKSGVVFEPEGMSDRISLNRFLSAHLPAYNRRMNIYAVGGGAAVVFIATMIGASSPLAIGLGLFTTAILLIWPAI